MLCLPPQLDETQSQLATATAAADAAAAGAALASAASVADNSLQQHEQQQRQYIEDDREQLQQRISELESELIDVRKLWSEQSDWQEFAERAASKEAAAEEKAANLEQQLAERDAQLRDYCGRDFIAQLEADLEAEREARADSDRMLVEMQDKLMALFPQLEADAAAIAARSPSPEQKSDSPEPAERNESVLDHLPEWIARISGLHEEELKGLRELHR